MDPPLIPPIKSKNNEIKEKCCVRLKLLRDPTSQKLDLYEFIMALFDNGKPEELLLFIHNFIMTPKASVTLADTKNIQYFCTFLSEEALHNFDILSAEVGSMTLGNLRRIILGFGTYFFLLMRFLNKNAR